MGIHQLAHDAIKFFQKTPFFRLFLALVCGIAFQIVVGFSHLLFSMTFWIGIVLMLGGYLFQKMYRYRWLFGMGITLWLFAIGLFLTQRTDENTQFRYINEQHTYLAKIVSPPRERPRSVLTELRLVSNLDTGEQLNNKVLAYLAKDSTSLSLQAGERLLVNVAFQHPMDFGNPYGFNYPRFLKRKGISATAFVPAEHWTQLDDTPPFSVINAAMRSRDKILSIYRDLNITGDEFSVLASLTLGYREELSPDLRQSYTAAGVVHVLAVSGMHVGVIFLVMSYLLGFMDKKRGSRIAKSLLIIALLWFYAFVTGLPPSAIRATFMLTFVILSKVFSSNAQTYNNVFAAAFFMLLYNPYFLFDIGFQFSYLAVLGIVYYQPKFALHFRNKYAKAAWSLLAVSLAAQLTTTPISLYYFNYFPNYFWISNVVVVPAISWIIYLAFALVFTSPIPFLNELVATATTWTIRIINEFIFFIQRLPYAVTENVWVDGWQLITVYAAIVLFTIAAVYRHGKSLVVGLGLVAVLFSVNAYTQHQTNTGGNRMLVAAMTDGYGISFVTGAKSYMHTDNDFQAHRALSPYKMRHRIRQPKMIDGSTTWFSDDGFVSFGGKRILILSENIFEGMIAEQPLEIDYLILTNNLRITMTELTRFVSPAKVIIDQSYRPWTTERLVADSQRLDIAYHVISERGAYVVRW